MIRSPEISVSRRQQHFLRCEEEHGEVCEWIESSTSVLVPVLEVVRNVLLVDCKSFVCQGRLCSASVSVGSEQFENPVHDILARWKLSDFE